MRDLFNSIIPHIEKTLDPLLVVNMVIGALSETVELYEQNRELIQQFLYYKYDLMGM